MARNSLTDGLLEVAGSVVVRPRTLYLAGAHEEATVPMLRGVWGRALRLLDEAAYGRVFQGTAGRGNAAGPPSLPGYLLRAGEEGNRGEEVVAVDWVLMGGAAEEDAPSLRRAWDMAAGLGLGPVGREGRQPFVLRGAHGLDPAGEPDTGGVGCWRLSEAVWPLAGDPETTPCALVFDDPVRLVYQRRLVLRPTLRDISLRVFERLLGLAPDAERAAAWRGEWKEAVLAAAAEARAGRDEWEPVNLLRYSGRQASDVELNGVAGALELPEGPGPVWPLLSAAQWIHAGKGTVVGMGRLRVAPL